MKNPTELHEVLDKIIDGISSGEIDVKDAVEINNAAGKRINLMKVQLEYKRLQSGNTGFVVTSLEE